MNNFEARQSLLKGIHGAASICDDLCHEFVIKDDSSDKNTSGSSNATDNSHSGTSSNGSSLASSSSNGVQSKSVINNDHNNNAENHNDDVRDNLMSQQSLQKLQQLSVHISSVKDAGDRLHMLFSSKKESTVLQGNTEMNSNENENESEKENYRLQNSLSDCKKNEAKNLKTISALQDYLIKEINRSEDADKDWKICQNDLVQMTFERNKYMKFLTQCKTLDHGKNRTKFNNEIDKILDLPLEAKNTSSSSEFNQEKDYTGSFVRKKFGGIYFFGYIFCLKRPFYKVVYEDSDEEEMSISDVRNSIW
jgi:hypothetical protein